MESSAGRSIRIVNKPLAGGGWVATHEDVTERQQLLEAQERAEAIVRGQKLQLDAALQNMSQGLCMFDPEGRIVLFNQRYAQMMDETADFLMGLSLLDLWKHRKALGRFAGDPEEFFASALKAARAGETKIRILERADGRCLRVVDQPMEGGGWVATFEDITEQRAHRAGARSQSGISRFDHRQRAVGDFREEIHRSPLCARQPRR